MEPRGKSLSQRQLLVRTRYSVLRRSHFINAVALVLAFSVTAEAAQSFRTGFVGNDWADDCFQYRGLRPGYCISPDRH